MWTLILSDGTELTGFRQNGTNYVSETEVDTSIFDSNLSTLTITDGETEIVMHNAELIQQVHYPDANPPGWYLCFRELTAEELEKRQLQQQIKLLTAQNQALADRGEFLEECIAEMAAAVYE